MRSSQPLPAKRFSFQVFIVASRLEEQGAVTTSRGKAQGTRHDTLHDLGLIAFCLKINSVPKHITMVADHQAGYQI